MSLKVRLISVLALFMLMLGILIMGVFAASQQLTLNGSINFNIQDRSLYVKDVRIKHDMSDSQPQSIDAFTPGYINQGFALDLNEISQTNTYGSFTLYFDVINTTESMWEIKNVTLPTILEEQGVFVSGYSGRVEVNSTLTDANGDSYKEITDVANTTYSTLTISISNPNASAENPLVLDGISITIDEYVSVIVTTAAVEENATETSLGLATGGGEVEIGQEVTLSASFTGAGDADFLGWKTSEQATEYISTLPNYIFTLEETSPTTYYAIFTEPNAYLTYDNFSTTDSTARLRRCSAGAENIIVPSAIYRTGSAYTVTSMYDSSSSSDGVFYQTRSTLQGVSLPETLTRIGEGAFRDCSGLTSITIPSSIIIIDSYAFENCSGLTSIVLPSTLTSIGSDVFDGCDNLQYNVDEYGVNYLGSESSPYLYLINDGTFNSGSYIIKNTCKLICPSAFRNCRGLTGVTLPSTLTSIGYNAFYNCSELTNIIIPEGVTSIGSYAFEDCSGLTSITIPDSVTSISNGAFYSCGRLTSITIPSSVTSIGSDAFRYCGLTSITIPEGVTRIGNNAFEYCNGLRSVILPSTLTSIGAEAFRYCYGLENTTINSTTPPTFGSYALDNTNNSFIIYVPAGVVETYKAADGWSNYADRISAIPTT